MPPLMIAAGGIIVSREFLPASVLADHLAWMRMQGRQPTTITGRAQALARTGRALPGPLLEATPGQLLAWRAGLTCRESGIRGEVSHLNQFYAWALARGLLAANPAAGLPVPRAGRRLPRPIGEDDLMQVLARAPARIRLWIVLAAWAGLRAKEIAFLRRECILLAHQPDPVVLIAADATKGINERAVPLCPFAVGEIEAARLPKTGWCFLRADGKPGPNTPARVSHVAAAHFRACDVSATLHMCRHRFGTILYATSGHDLRLVQETLGHLKIESTAGYADWHKPAAAAAVGLLPVPPKLHVIGEAG